MTEIDFLLPIKNSSKINFRFIFKLEHSGMPKREKTRQDYFQKSLFCTLFSITEM